MSQRFSDAELAAEYWALEAEMAYSESCITGAAFNRLYDMQEAFHRFATLPHAHQETHYCECGHLDVHHYGQVGHCLDNYNPMRGCACQAFK